MLTDLDPTAHFVPTTNFTHLNDLAPTTDFNQMIDFTTIDYRSFNPKTNLLFIVDLHSTANFTPITDFILTTNLLNRLKVYLYGQ